ncbi:hypothetical protein HIM_03230 [Hirsutella minnesotensis 3608]|nr:hypothetical protein HIM_03230 [Hirsutella minnesotensis 3608]
MSPLFHLPRELLDMILDHLSVPWSFTVPLPAPPQSQHDVAERRARLAALSALARSCKALQFIVQPRLFTFVSPGRRAARIVLTLLRRPDLAASVKHLSLADNYGSDYSESRETDRSLRQQLMLSSRTLDIGRAVPFVPWYDEGQHMTALAIALVPNVQRLLIRAHSSYHLRFQPGYLPFLTELFLQNCDGDMGFAIAQFDTLFKAAPSLQIFRGHRAVGHELNDQAFAHAGLKTIELCCACLGRACFNAVMTNFPSLERFSYASRGLRGNMYGAEADLRGIIDSLPTRRNTLKHVSLDMTFAVLYDPWELGLDEADSAPSLRQMTALETVKLSGSALSNMFDRAREAGFPEVRLCDFLPPNIRTLGVDRPHPKMLDDFTVLAAMAPTSFPLFREVHIGTKFESTDSLATLQPAFAKSGIRCIAQDVFQRDPALTSTRPVCWCGWLR